MPTLSRRRLIGALIAVGASALIAIGGPVLVERVGDALAPVSLRTRVEAVSFEPPAGWRVGSGSADEIEAAFADAGLTDLRGTFEGLGVSELTQALALTIADGEPTAALRADLLPASGQGDPAGIRDAALLTIGLDESDGLERIEGTEDGIPYAGYRAGEGLARRTVLFISFVPGIVRLTILAPDPIADLLVASLAYDPPPAPEVSPSSSP